jgi:uncharacterized phage protein (TIGR01671 family)
MILKFRAWIERPKMMVDITAINFVEHTFSFERGNGFTEWLSQNEKSIVVMQSTGAFDKNGKEIYEGDIVKGIDYSIYAPYSIVKVEYFANELKYSIDCLDLSDLEVIGNIYQNPELLEEEEK